MSANCCPPIPAPTCELTCEELTCELNALKVNVANLFDRTNDLNGAINAIQIQIADIEAQLASIDANLDAIEADIAALQAQVTSISTIVNLYTQTFKLVTTSAELDAALPTGGLILIAGEITRTDAPDQTVHITEPYTQLIGVNINGVRSAIIYPHATGEARKIIQPHARNITIKNLRLTTNHPLVSDMTDNDTAIYIGGDPIEILNSLVVEDCEIYNIGFGFWREGNLLASIIYSMRIRNCFIHDFCGNGLYMNYNFDDLVVEDNEIWGRYDSVGHVTNTQPGLGNAIFIGILANNTKVRRNTCANVDRHLIEIWNDRPAGNQNPEVVDNVVQDGIFGISVLANGDATIARNRMIRSKHYGIECVGDVINQGRYHVYDNVIKDVEQAPGQSYFSVGIIFDNVQFPSEAYNNTIHTIYAGIPSGATNENSFGIVLYHGGRDIVIRNNNLVDAGAKQIGVNTNDGGTYDNITIKNNRILCSTDYAVTPPLPPPDGANWWAIYIQQCTLALVIGNEVWYPVASVPFNNMQILSGSLHQDYTGVIPIGGATPIAGNNLQIGY